MTRLNLLATTNMKLPKTKEEVILGLTENKKVSKNFLEAEADRIGMDYDHIRGFDDDLNAKEPRKYEEVENH